jgi:hypothetical protein
MRKSPCICCLVACYFAIGLTSCRSSYRAGLKNGIIHPDVAVVIKPTFRCPKEVTEGPYITFRGDFKNDFVRIKVNEQLVFSDTVSSDNSQKYAGYFDMKELPNDQGIQVSINDGEYNMIDWNNKFCYMNIIKRRNKIAIRNSKAIRTGAR